MEVVFCRKRGRGVALAVLLGALTCITWSQQVLVPPGEQSVRDEERLRILQAELLELQRRSDAAARQHAERLAAHDSTATDEAEQAHARAVADISALQREIESVRSSGTAGKPAPTSRLMPRREVAWWDVYANTPAHTRDGGAPAAP